MKYKDLFILLLASGALIFSGCGKKKSEEKAKEDISGAVVRQNIVVEEEESKEQTPAVIKYKVMLSGEKLSLYEVDGERKRLITSMDIDPELYPAEDVKRLKNGIEADFLEDGYEILENFAN